MIYSTGSGPFQQLVLDPYLGASVRLALLPHLSSSLIRANDRWSSRVGGGTDCPRRSSASQACSDGAGCVCFSGSAGILDISLALINRSVVSKEAQRRNGREQQTNVSSNKSTINLCAIVALLPAPRSDREPRGDYQRQTSVRTVLKRGFLFSRRFLKSH